MSEEKKEFSAFSSLFNQVIDSMFIRDNVSYKIWRLSNDIGSNLEILDESRLRRRLFNEIDTRYQDRIDHYHLKKNPLTEEEEKNLEINSFLLTNDTEGFISGTYTIYPRAFYCDKCGDFQLFYDSDKWKNFDATKCHKQNCDGKYIQFPFVGFCEKCGTITDSYALKCEHKDKYLKLVQYDVTSPITWKLRCTKCNKEWDFLKTCYHTKSNEKLVDNNIEPDKFRPINVQQGSVFRSVVITTVDIPKDLHLNDIPYLDYISFGLYRGYFNKIKEDCLDIFIGLPYILNEIDIKSYNFERDCQYFPTTEEDIIESYDYFLKQLRNLILEEDLHIAQDVNDYLILTGFYYYLFGMDDENNYLDVTKFEDLNNNFEIIKDSYESIKDELGIEDIFYISDIRLISSSIGSIKGMTKMESDFIPHFEPYINKKTNNLQVISYPYETEAILFDLDKIKLANWLIDNGFLEKEHPKTKEEAKKILLNLKKDGNDDAYNYLKNLIHTFSHVLINRSSLYTGLQSDSCSELLFPSLGAFLIYSTSNINIGGFLYVLENSLFEWFRDVKFDVSDCIFDPVCIDDKGACFSCIYLPEYVCCNFNQDLDRDVFLGTKRYKKGYWE